MLLCQAEATGVVTAQLELLLVHSWQLEQGRIEDLQ